MTRFAKDNFNYHGGYLTYTMPTGKQEFVARFKHRGPVTKAKFIKSITRNYTVEQYFHKLNVEKRAPLQILKDDHHLYFDAIAKVFVLDGKVLA